MQRRHLGRTDMNVSVIGFGAWAIGGSWGTVDDGESMRALHASVDAGVNFFDTADVYGDGRSERLVGQLRRERPRGHDLDCHEGRTPIAGADTRRLFPREPSILDRAQPEQLRVEAIHPLQLHCPPPLVYDRPEVSARWTSSSVMASSLLRRERGDVRANAARDALSERSDRAHHLPHVPHEAGGARLPGGKQAAGGDPRACPSQAVF